MAIQTIPTKISILEKITEKVQSAAGQKRPLVTLSFAQSLDGSISLSPLAPVRLSNRDSQVFTHRLRALHDAILVGIGTLIADDPRLNVRFVKGENPRPVIVDSRLRFPVKARVCRQPGNRLTIASTPQADSGREASLKKEGIEVLRFPALENGWVNLNSLLEHLFESGVRSVMVEGGARIIQSFLQAKIVDQLVVTVTPVLLGGFRALHKTDLYDNHPFQCLENVMFHEYDGDLIVRGDFAWGNGV